MKKMLFPLLSAALLASPSAMADEKEVASADEVFSSSTTSAADKSTADADTKQEPKSSESEKSSAKPSSKKTAPKTPPATPTLGDVEDVWHDPAFDQFVSIPLLGQAIDENDVEGLTNSALQFVHAERVLFRSHKAITAEDVFSRALKAAYQADNKSCTERLTKAAKASGNDKLVGIVDSVGKLMAGSRSTDGQFVVNIDAIDAEQYRQLCDLRDSVRRAQLIGHPHEYEQIRCRIEEIECPDQCRKQLLNALGHPPDGDDTTSQAVGMLADYTRSCKGGGGGFSGGFSGGGFGGMSQGGSMSYGGMTQGGMHQGGMNLGGGFAQGGHRLQPMQPQPMRAATAPWTSPSAMQASSQPRPGRSAAPTAARPTAPAAAPQQPSLAQQLAKLTPQQKAALIQQLSGSQQQRPTAAQRPAALPPTGVRPASATLPTAPRPGATLSTARPGQPQGGMPRSLPPGGSTNAAAANLLGAGSRSLNGGEGESSWAPWFEGDASGIVRQGMIEHKPDGSWVKYDSEGNAIEAGYDAGSYTGGQGDDGGQSSGNEAGGIGFDYTQNADGSTSWTQYDANGNFVDTGIEIDAGALNGLQTQQPQPRQLQATPQSPSMPNGQGTAARQTSGGSGMQAGTGSRVTPADAQAALNLHNQARREVGNRPMQWSTTLAQDAQRIADSLAARGVFDHEGRNAENLSAGTPSAASATRNFLEEKLLYQQGERAGMKVGHYTQMVWHNTTELGIGIAVYQSGPYRGRHVVVARYNPGGNMMGEEAYRGAGVIHW